MQITRSHLLLPQKNSMTLAKEFWRIKDQNGLPFTTFSTDHSLSETFEIMTGEKKEK